MAALLLSGCTTKVIPPQHPPDPVTIYLADYGRHSSILLPGAGGGYDEYAFGDWEFFAEGNTRWWVALRALFCSPRSTLGQRHIKVPKSLAAVNAALGSRSVQAFQASRPRAQALKMTLGAPFRRRSGELMYSSYSMLHHVPGDEEYRAWHNCNHVTADWLRRLGCEIHGTAAWSDFRVVN